MKKIVFLFIGLLIITHFTFSQDHLKIDPSQKEVAIVVYPEEKGFHLYVKAVDGLGSVLITESSKDPNKKYDTYSLRAYDYNPINGDEKKILNGEFVPSKEKEWYFLIDSTPEYVESLGFEAFHIYVPRYLTYGFEWTREGQVELTQGSWLNIRAFEKPYADHSGLFLDNPFTLRAMKQLPPEPKKPDVIMGKFHPIPDRDGTMAETARIIRNQKSDNIDLVLVIDTTMSMKEDLRFIQREFIKTIKETVAGYEHFRVGIVLYRDYKEAYVTKEYPFKVDLAEIQKILNQMKARGGRDLQEAVYEGLYSALINYDWQAETRLIIQKGDALPHDEPQGSITEKMVLDAAEELGVTIHPIFLE